MTRPTLREWWHRVTGKASFRVQYPNGYLGCPHCYKEAQLYAEMGTGQVVFDPK